MKPMKAAQRKVFEDATNEYEDQLWAGDNRALDFLRETKGLSDETIRSFRLGLVHRPTVASHEMFKDRLAIPNLLVDSNGQERPAGLKFRYLGADPKAPKFLYPQGQSLRLYNLRAVVAAGDLIALAEGESDTWSLVQAGIPCVGIPGANNWGQRDGYRRLIFEGFPRVILCQDNDDAGANLAASLSEIEGLEVRSMKPHKDASELLLTEGAEALRQRVLTASDDEYEEPEVEREVTEVDEDQPPF